MSYLGAEGDAFSRSIANALEAFRKGVDEELRKKDELIRQMQAKVNASMPARVDSGFQAPELSEFDEGEDYSDVPPIPYKDHARLVRDYNVLTSNLRSMRKAKESIERTARNKKSAAMEWKNYAEELEEKLKERCGSDLSLALPSKRPATPGFDNTTSRPSTADTVKEPRKGLSEKAARSPLHIVENLHQDQTSKKTLARIEHSDQSLPDADGRHSEADEVLNAPKSAIPSSSQVTESETGTQFQSDDGPRIPSSPPVIVSERVLKRKRGGADPVPFSVGERGESTPAKPINIKSELQSSPRRPSTVRRLNRVETLDLDEVEGRIETPRKRRRRQERQKTTAPPSNLMLDQRSSSLPPVIGFDAAIRPPGCLDDDEDIIFRDEDEEMFMPHDDRALSEPTAVDNQKYDTPLKSSAPKVLHPISANQRILPRTSGMDQKSKRRDETRGAKALHMVAEDGNFSSTIENPLSRQSSFNADLLDHLLDEPAPIRKQLASPAANSRQRHRLPPELPPLSLKKEDRRRILPATSDNIQLPTPVTTKPARSMLTAEGVTTPLGIQRRRRNAAESDDTPSRGRPTPLSRSKGGLSRPPLRNKPVNTLNIDDFKLNPKAKGGLDLAYADPVRGREARSHLEGCTDPNCANCGDQIQALAAELDITVGSHLFESTQDGNLTNEERLLKFYLGDLFDLEKGNTLEQDTKTRMILQAKTKLLADRIGRHKIKPMGRAKSPPGFWNFDMPTTQQLEAQREEADKRQKLVIEERHREAMRPGGRWIFRDE